jgi:hypothetical protein
VSEPNSKYCTRQPLLLKMYQNNRLMRHCEKFLYVPVVDTTVVVDAIPSTRLGLIKAAKTALRGVGSKPNLVGVYGGLLWRYRTPRESAVSDERDTQIE